MAALEDAIALAVDAHKGQVDKAGAPYILHPLRVMLALRSDEEMMVGVLHDVVEDSAYAVGDLEAQGFPPAVVEAVDCLTRREGETYEAFIERLMPNALARRVKIADLDDNMNIRRIADPQERDFERLKKYLRAWSLLAGVDS